MGWLLAVASGVLLLGAFPGTGDQAWLAFVALVPLLLALDGAGRARAAALGFVSASAFWGVTIGWPAPAVLHFGGVPLHRGALTVAVVVALLSLYTALFAALLAAVPRRPATAWVAVAGCLWVALEFLRTYLFTGFPWNLLGTSQYQTLPLIQVAAVTGVYGVSFVVLAVNAALTRLAGALVHGVQARTAGTARMPSPGERRGRALDAAGAAGMAGVTVGLALAGGALGPAADHPGPGLSVAIAQGNIDQSVKWDPAYRDATLGIYGALTREAARGGARLVVWPETAVPLVRRDEPQWATVTDLAPETGAFLLVGAPDQVAGEPRNSVFVLAPDGTPRGRYDKRHLLPFGEYLPDALAFLRVVGGGAINEFTPGAEPAVLATPLGRLAPLICFEIIFPAEARARVARGADVLVNVTNDAWFGRGPTARQHLAAAVFRAVENRIWLVRAANSGISAIVAPDGRIVHASGLFTREVIAGTVAPRAGTTPYTRHGDVFAWACAGVAAAFAPLPARQRRRVERPATAG